METRILIVDDDALLRQSLKVRLEQEGYQVTTAGSGADGLRSAQHDPPDLVLLDIGLPDQLGLDFARTLRRESAAPVIFLTARKEETDIVVGLELGADDYITKPFGTYELLARIRAVLRRAARPAALIESQVLSGGDIQLDVKAHQVRVRNELVSLAPKEFDLLRLLLANPGIVLSTDYLLNAVWGVEFSGAQQVLYVHIGWLRERIEVDPRHPRHIVTVRGVGYKFVVGENDG